MKEPFIAEISIFAGSYSPKGWALCNGQLLAISENLQIRPGTNVAETLLRAM